MRRYKIHDYYNCMKIDKVTSVWTRVSLGGCTISSLQFVSITFAIIKIECSVYC